jgi:hypothetical protein
MRCTWRLAHCWALRSVWH